MAGWEQLGVGTPQQKAQINQSLKAGYDKGPMKSMGIPFAAFQNAAWQQYGAQYSAAQKPSGLGGELKEGWSQQPGMTNNPEGDFNLSTIADPLDALGGRAAKMDAAAAQDATNLAALGGAQSQQRMIRKQLKMTAPYREMGGQALGQLQGSLKQGSPLDSLRSDLTKKFMSGYLEKQGFGEDVAGAVTQQRLDKTGAAESTSRRGRAQDLMSLGFGQAAQGAGMAGSHGASQARNIMAAQANQAQMLTQQEYARQGTQAALMYGGQRAAGDYLSQREADRYGGY